MKSIVSIDKEIGDGLKVKAGIGVEGSDLAADVRVVFPLAKVIDPVMKIVDGLVDKVEKLIPGDQTTLAESLKAAARADLVKLLSEKAE